MAVLDTATAVRSTSANPTATVLWAGLDSTLHRLRRGEGALLAINLSLIVQAGGDFSRSLAQALVSLLTLIALYAFNDFWDAPTDASNPRKDRALVTAYLEYRRLSLAAIATLKLLALALALSTLGAKAAGFVAAVLVVNVLYSTILKGVPVIDVVVCGLWGALYAGIVDPTLVNLVLIALMTAICHMYQALGDRAADAANGVITTAVRSTMLSTVILFGLSFLFFMVSRDQLGGVLALTAFAPALFCLVVEPHTGWLLSKVYFGLVWLYVLGFFHAVG